jgi:hypothetical protein
MTTAPTATPTMAPVERPDFAVVAVPPVLSGVELPGLVVPPVVVLGGVTVLGTGEELDVSVALPGAEVEDAVVTALVVDTEEDGVAIAVLLPGDTYNRISQALIFKEEIFALKYIPKKHSYLPLLLHH